MITEITLPHIQTRQPDWRCRIRGMLAILCVALLLLASADADAADYSKEDAVKAAFIFHFALFVEWPADRSETITIGVFGEDPFNGALEIIQGKMVNGQSIQIKQLLSTDRAVDNVQILIVGWSDENTVTSILASTANRPILTVADLDVFKVEGAIISLFRKGTRQKFGVDRQAASRAGLILSSQLPQIAAVVN
jgi:hypothetical protein